MNERITPWFGVWSPELKGVQKMDDENHEVKWWHRLLRLSWLLGIAVFCFLPLVFIPSLHSGINVLLSTLGSTSLVVWLLAGTVDWWLKKAILKDVFKAAIGYLLPPELRPEMEWVYKQDIIAIKHIQHCKITPLGENLVTLEIAINRKFKNVSQHTTAMKPILSIDEWFHNVESSKIIEIGWGNGGNKWECERDEYTLNIKESAENEISLAPGATIDIWQKYSEIKHINDHHVNTFLYATNNPFIEVEAFDGLGVRASFALHKQQTMKSRGENRYELDGTLLPGQQIYIRWWSIKDSEKWLSEGSQSKNG